jgi:hypothetical protein
VKGCRPGSKEIEIWFKNLSSQGGARGVVEWRGFHFLLSKSIMCSIEEVLGERGG